MKRDMDLVRTILLEIEEAESPGPSGVKLVTRGYSPELTADHILLLKEAGLIEAINAGGLDGDTWIVQRLTWRGHEFLDAARNSSVWQKLKTEIKDRGMSLPFSVIEALVIKLAADAMKKH